MIQKLYQSDLQKMLDYPKAPFSSEDLEVIMIDLIHGLKAIHERGLIHDDLKRQNILVEWDVHTNRVIEAVICDLGMVRDCALEYTVQEKEEYQNSEVKCLLRLFVNMYTRQNVRIPIFLEELLAESKITPKLALEWIASSKV